MRCPFCGSQDDKVIDSRSGRDGAVIRRRRECLQCGRRFTTHEYIERITLSVVKADGRREPYSRQKLIAGIQRACTKRPVSAEVIEDMVGHIEDRIHARWSREVATREIGELVMEALKPVDEVAYVRFASVYRKFKDKSEFLKELNGLMGKAP